MKTSASHKAVAALAVLSALVGIGLTAAMIWVLIHFVAKYW